MAGIAKDPGQKHSIRGAHPTRIQRDACGMYTTDDSPGDSAHVADAAVSSHLPRLGAAPPDPSSPDAGVLPWAAWAALLFWCHLGRWRACRNTPHWIALSIEFVKKLRIGNNPAQDQLVTLRSRTNSYEIVLDNTLERRCQL
jgi:hypothetical protein